jgi:parvulin-like peptidyl-prolyl isomerase
MNHRTIRSALALAVLACTVPAQGERPSTRSSAEYVDSVAAKVNRTVITKSQVDRELGSAASRLSESDYERQFRIKLLQLVAAAIEQDAVEKVGLVVPKRYLLEQVELQKERKGAAEVAAGIREQGYKSEEEYVEALGRDVSRQTYVAAQAGQYKAPQFRPDYWTEPTATEIRQYYRQHTTDEFLQKNQARVSGILLPYAEFAPPTAPNEPKDLAAGASRARAIADTIRGELAAGAEFAVLARRYSRGLKVDDGGDLGWITADAAYQPEIVSFALNGPVKTLSDPILYPTKTAARGIAVVYVHERVEERVMPFEEAQAKIRDTLRAQRVDAARRKIVQKKLQDAYISPGDVKRDLLRAYQQ